MRSRRFAAPLVTMALAGGLLASVTPTVAAPPDVPVVEWGTCGKDAPQRLQCATVEVPLDYVDPESEALLELDLLRVQATGDPSERLGSLFVNPGGPGGSATGFAAWFGRLVPSEIRERYDIVGIDPRGVGQSAPMVCRTDEKRPPYPRAWFPTTVKQATRQIRLDDWLRGACAPGDARDAPVVAHMSTADTARDMDLVREALGDTDLNYYGISYGTQLGSTYAAMFPDNVGRMILDGVLDPVAWTTGRGAGAGTTMPFSERLRSGYGAWQALTAAFAECDRVGKRRCVLAGHASEAWLDVVRRLERKPFRSERTGRITYDVVVGSALSYLYYAEGVPYLMRSIKRLHRAMFGKGSLRVTDWRQGAVARRVDEGGGIPGPYAAGFARTGSPFVGVACADSDNPSDPRAWIRAGNRADRVSPWFGKLWTWASSPCAGWPEEYQEDRYAGPFETVTANPVLVVGNTYDPATPLHGARAVNRLLDGSRLLVLDGWGHGALDTGPCIDQAYRDYLVDGTLPPAGTVCKPRRELFPR
jgi:pimeloyl-ACP methyl ester carboxylesterase